MWIHFASWIQWKGQNTQNSPGSWIRSQNSSFKRKRVLKAVLKNSLSLRCWCATLMQIICIWGSHKLFVFLFKRHTKTQNEQPFWVLSEMIFTFIISIQPLSTLLLICVSASYTRTIWPEFLMTPINTGPCTKASVNYIIREHRPPVDICLISLFLQEMSSQ